MKNTRLTVLMSLVLVGCATVTQDSPSKSESSAEMVDRELSSADAFSVEMALRPDGRPIIIWSEKDALRLHDCADVRCELGETRTLVSDQNQPGAKHVYIRDDGRPLITYGNLIEYGHDELWLYECTNVDCSSGERHKVDTGQKQPGHALTFAMTASGGALISHQQFDDQRASLITCDDPLCADNSVRILDKWSSGRDQVMVIPPDGKPLIVYHKSQGGYKPKTGVKVYDCADTACSDGTSRFIDGLSNSDSDDDLMRGRRSQFDSDVALLPDGRAVISYREGHRQLWTYACADMRCTTGVATKHELMDKTSAGARITIGADGLPRILLVNDYTIGVFTCADQDCADGNFAAISPAKTPGIEAALLTTQAGDLLVAFADPDSGGVRLVECPAQNCALTGAAIDTRP